MGWEEILMKMKRMKINHQGDDFFLDRLFSYLCEQFPFPIESIKPIRNHVYLIESQSEHFVLKGFPSYHRLKLQETFTASLKREGFDSTYSFLNLINEDYIFFEPFYYGCLEYIIPSNEPFTFEKEKDRLDGLEILHDYHEATGKLMNRYQTLISRYKVLEKWRERTAKFLENMPIIRFFMQKEMIDELLKWADWSLKGVEKELHSCRKNRAVILHGDVAHHNFLRSHTNHLFLIDFDLICIGDESFDYLQYANRILPLLDWSFEELEKIKKMEPFLKESAFLYSLAYPTDIFREWNRLIRERSYTDSVKTRPILDFTVNQFMERRSFFHELQSIVKA